MNAIELVNNQESFFDSVNTGVVSWPKEAQFAIQALQGNDFLCKSAMANPASLQNAIINVAAIGISLNPALKHAYLVPRKKETGGATLVCLDISYQGLLSLAMKSGAIEWGQAKIVYENDTYENQGIDKSPIHQQKTFGEKGKIVGAYCTVKTSSGDYLTEEMDFNAITKVQNTSKAANGPWKTWWEEMARKTVVKRASKYWPQSESDSLGAAVNVLNEQEGFKEDTNAINGKAVEVISEDKISELHELILAAGMDEAGFCGHKKIKIESLSYFPLARFEGAKNWLKSLGEKNDNN
jgi:recombination protein RecT